MTFSYNLVFETVESSPDLNIEHNSSKQLRKIEPASNYLSKSILDKLKYLSVEETCENTEENKTAKDKCNQKLVFENSTKEKLSVVKDFKVNSSDTTKEYKEKKEEENSRKDTEKEKTEHRRNQERGTRKPSEIVVETFYSKMNYSEAVCGSSSSKSSCVGGSSSTSTTRKSSSARTAFSRESTPASGSKDFPPLPTYKEKSSSGSREGSITSESKESTPSERSRQKSSKESTPVEPDSINFISGNPFVEVTNGIIHLFKDQKDPEYRKTEMMCMYGVPAQHKTCDILQFTAPCHPDLEYMRFIHDGSPNQYIVLLKFRSAESAAEFHEVYNGRPYNNLEPDLCSVLPVSSVQHCKESEYYPNTEGSTELPYCTICLERMDESVSTVLTILCNHKFHTGCIAQWEDPTCPVCRHVQTPELLAEHVCQSCQSSSDLWICLVCGFVGCGRYAGGHAHQHFLETQHCYSMELGHNRVWDYVGDNFVHRLVQNTTDGKLVEQEGGGEDHKQRGNIDGVAVDSEEKMDSLQLEYTYLLTSQLESQREYFEGKLSRVTEDASKEIQELSDRCRVELEEKRRLQKQLDQMNKEKGRMEAKISQLTGKMSQLTTSLEEEQQLNRSLRQNQDDWQMRLKRTEIELNVNKEQKDREIQDLKDQVRDLMFYMEAQSKIKESPLCSELQEGTLMVREGETEDGESPRKQGKRGKRRGH